jgi:hypothetical protein
MAVVLRQKKPHINSAASDKFFMKSPLWLANIFNYVSLCFSDVNRQRMIISG